MPGQQASARVPAGERPEQRRRELNGRGGGKPNPEGPCAAGREIVCGLLRAVICRQHLASMRQPLLSDCWATFSRCAARVKFRSSASAAK